MYDMDIYNGSKTHKLFEYSYKNTFNFSHKNELMLQSGFKVSSMTSMTLALYIYLAITHSYLDKLAGYVQC